MQTTFQLKSSSIGSLDRDFLRSKNRQSVIHLDPHRSVVDVVYFYLVVVIVDVIDAARRVYNVLALIQRMFVFLPFPRKLYDYDVRFVIFSVVHRILVSRCISIHIHIYTHTHTHTHARARARVCVCEQIIEADEIFETRFIARDTLCIELYLIKRNDFSNKHISPFIVWLMNVVSLRYYPLGTILQRLCERLPACWSWIRVMELVQLRELVRLTETDQSRHQGT